MFVALRWFYDLVEHTAATSVGTTAQQWMLDRAYLPIGACLVYFVLVFPVHSFMKTRSALNLKSMVAVWNLLLSIFSIWGAVRLIPYMLNVAQTQGVRYTFCHDPKDGYYYDGTPGFWLFAFGGSKFFELMDTVFLVLQKKPVNFLHWYHHFTVLLFTWCAIVTELPYGPWFASMNYFVHSIMYTYYFLMTFTATRSFAKLFSFYITTLQVLQMVVGLGISIVSLWGNSAECPAHTLTTLSGTLMYASYFVLFGNMMYQTYFTAKGKHSRVAGSPTSPVTPVEATSPTTRGRSPSAGKRSKKTA